MSNSPFRPGYGRPPLVFGGHERELEELESVFRDFDYGENQTLLISGLRGSGKTSMLGELRGMAQQHGWLVISDNASPGMYDRIASGAVPALINCLTEPERRTLAGFGLWHFSATWQIENLQRQARPLLRRDLLAIDHVTEGRGLLITIDEVTQGNTDKREIGELALELSHALEEGANLVVVFAGIKLDLDELVRQKHLTFLRRSRRIDFRRLSPAQTRHVLSATAATGGRSVDKDALEHLVRVSQGYPYLVQLLGDYAWRHDPDSDSITVAAAEAVRKRSVDAIMDRVISRAYGDLSDVDKLFVRALASCDGRAKMAQVIEAMRALAESEGRDSAVITQQYANQYRNRLIDTGYVEADGRGYVRFSLPYLGDYIRSMHDELSVVHEDAWQDYPPPPL